MMAEKWRRYDSMKVLTQKFNDAMDELNAVVKSQTLVEDTNITIDDGLSDEDIQQILSASEVTTDG